MGSCRWCRVRGRVEGWTTRGLRLRVPAASARITFHVDYIGEVFGDPMAGFQQGDLYDGRLELAVVHRNF